MTCANWGITIFSAVILILSLWPSIFSATSNKVIIIVSAAIILLIAWTGCGCKYCGNVPKQRRR